MNIEDLISKIEYGSEGAKLTDDNLSMLRIAGEISIYRVFVVNKTSYMIFKTKREINGSNAFLYRQEKDGSWVKT